MPSNTRRACPVLQRRWTCISRLPGGTLPRYILPLIAQATGEPITQRLLCLLGLTNTCVDRAEHSKRQDWSLEASYDIFPLLEPLLAYTVKTLLDKSNILRDSVLMQAECLHFEAYVHVCTIMWRVVFKELRGLTNSKVNFVAP